MSIDTTNMSEEELLDLGFGPMYQRIDRKRFREAKGDVWSGLDCLGAGPAIMMDWESAFGTALETLRPYLRQTGGRVESIACPAMSGCGCRHELSEKESGEFIAGCVCEHEYGCDRYLLEPADVLLHGLDVEAFGRAIARAMDLAEPLLAQTSVGGFHQVGVFAAVAVPVYLCLLHSARMLNELTRLCSQREGPFLVLTPTGSSWSVPIESFARAQGGAHISLSSVLSVDGGWKANEMLQPMLAEFGRRVATLRSGGETLKNIHREIASVRQEYAELKSSKQRLEKMLADGMFAFTRKIDPASFKVFCSILAEGDVAKASRTLETSEDSVRSVVRRWAGRGKEYETMAELVRWRKKVGRREKVPLNDAILHERAQSVDYPGLLSDVLDGLLSVNEENWDERCQELAELLRPVVREAGK
jgi:hypothetical protein